MPDRDTQTRILRDHFPQRSDLRVSVCHIDRYEHAEPIRQAEYGLMYLKNGDLKSVLSLSLPNLLCSFAALLLLCIDRKRLRLSYLLWSLVYFALSIGATWLLSGPRYLAMVFPLAMVLGRLCKTRSADLLTEGSLLVIQTGYLLMLALDLYVY